MQGAEKAADFMPVSVKGIEHHKAIALDRSKDFIYDAFTFKQSFPGEEIPFKMGELITATEQGAAASQTASAKSRCACDVTNLVFVLYHQSHGLRW